MQRTQRYCSPHCRNRRVHPGGQPVIVGLRPCERCSATFKVARNYQEQRWCSKRCAVASQPRRIKAPPKPCPVYAKSCGRCARLFTARTKARSLCGLADCAPPMRMLTCMDCGLEELRPTKRGRVNRRCDACVLERARDRRHAGKVARRSRLGTVDLVVRKAIYERDGWQCQLCHQPVRQGLRSPNPRSASLDHIVPVSLGGKHERANVQLAHLRCNNLKGNRGVFQLRWAS